MKKSFVLLCILSMHIFCSAQDIYRDNANQLVTNENYSISLLPYASGNIMIVELNNINSGNVVVELFSFSGKFLQKIIIRQNSQYAYFNLGELDSDEYVVRIQTPMAIKYNKIKVAKI
jgi:hypothetical protein